MPETLADLAYRHAMGANSASIPRVTLHLAQREGWPIEALQQPMFGAVLRGTKRVVVGDRTIRYDSDHFLIASIDVPASRVVVEDKPHEPYVALRLAIDQQALSEVIVEGPSRTDQSFSAFAVGKMTCELKDAWGRMLRLLDKPDEINVLAPLIEREILFRILQGPQGFVLRQAALADSRIEHVRAAIAHLRSNLDRQVSIDELRTVAGMSAATLNRHFRSVTGLSPLAYQKALRLQEARRMMIVGRDVASAAFATGYSSTSQFSREYSRMFSLPPGKDAARLRMGH